MFPWRPRWIRQNIPIGPPSIKLTQGGINLLFPSADDFLLFPMNILLQWLKHSKNCPKQEYDHLDGHLFLDVFSRNGWGITTDLNRTYERSERLLAATCQLCVFVCSVEVLSAIHMQGKKCLCLQFAIHKSYYFSYLIIALTFKSL